VKFAAAAGHGGTAPCRPPARVPVGQSPWPDPQTAPVGTARAPAAPQPRSPLGSARLGLQRPLQRRFVLPRRLGANPGAQPGLRAPVEQHRAGRPPHRHRRDPRPGSLARGLVSNVFLWGYFSEVPFCWVCRHRRAAFLAGKRERRGNRPPWDGLVAALLRFSGNF